MLALDELWMLERRLVRGLFAEKAATHVPCVALVAKVGPERGSIAALRSKDGVYCIIRLGFRWVCYLSAWAALTFTTLWF